MTHLLRLMILLIFVAPSAWGWAEVPTYRVGTTGDYPPLTNWNPTRQQFEGVDIHRMVDLAQDIGFHVVWVKTSWPTLLEDMKHHRFDMAIGGISITPERLKWGVFSTPYLCDGKVVLSRCEWSTVVKQLKDFDQPRFRVIENAGGTNEKMAKQYFKRAKLTVVKDNQWALNRLKQNYADLMITDGSEAQYQVQQAPGVLCLLWPNQRLSQDQKGIWIHPTLPQPFIQRLNQALIKEGCVCTQDTPGP